MTILAAAAAMAGLALVFGLVLGLASERMAVAVDPRFEIVIGLLPGANCGRCGHAGCAPYARAVVAGADRPDRCSVGGPPVARRVALALGVALEPTWPTRPVLHCGAKSEDRLGRAPYAGRATCADADTVGGVQGCTYGCLGFGDCVTVCDFDAIAMVDGLPRIDYEKCTGCGACVAACPRRILEPIPFRARRMMVVACANPDPGRAVRDVCRTGCIGCARCARLEPGLFHVDEGLATIDYRRYTGEEDLEAVRAACPMKTVAFLGGPDPEEKLVDPPEGPLRPTAEDMDWRG